MLYQDLKHKMIAKCFRSNKAQTVSFLDVFWNEPHNTLIHEEGLEIYLLLDEKNKLLYI